MGFKIFKNWFFYGGFVVFLLIFNYLLNGSAFSFGNLSFWSMSQNIRVGNEYVREKTSDNTIVGVTLANIKLGEGDFNFHYYLGQAVELTKTQQLLVENDTLELLESSSNKRAILESHLNEIELTLGKTQDILATIFDTANEKKTDAVTCENSKNQADNSFFQGLSSNEKDTIIEGLADSLSNGQCFSENRIYANAYYAVYDKLNFYNKVLEQKRLLIENNQDLIIENYQMFKDKTLEKLVSLRDEIISYNGSSYQTE